ncbi:hypothetical protein ACFW1P_02605 [Paenibacillus sp. NPDC058910]|uniref:hypothetical protein n=1 Tax=unclassified Paenibacillus TaxID=185978 RepID=UPI003693E902
MGETINKWIYELINHGVSEQHIEEVKGRKLRSTSPYEYFYDKDEKAEIVSLVDTKKIAGINTGWPTAGRTVFNLFFSVTGEISTKNSLNYNRIKENLESLIANGITYQYSFYVDKSIEYRLRDGLPKFIYYKDDDIYFSGATHRTISALMFNAPKMIGYVTTYSKNQKKYENYSTYSQIRDSWNEFIKKELENIELNKIQEDRKQYNRQQKYTLKFKNYPEINLMGIYDPIIEPYKLDFQDSDRIMTIQKNTIQMISKIKRIDQETKTEWFNKSKKLPVTFSLLKKYKCYVLYDLLYEIKFPKNKFYINIEEPLESIIDKIKYNLISHTIYKNKPIKGF